MKCAISWTQRVGRCRMTYFGADGAQAQYERTNSFKRALYAVPLALRSFPRPALDAVRTAKDLQADSTHRSAPLESHYQGPASLC